MGIDIYARARRQAQEQADLKYNEKYSGKRGYLREAYHGGPYATKLLVQEAFDADYEDMEKDEDGDSLGVQISAETLKERLPATVLLAGYRHVKLYGGDKDDKFCVNLDDGEEGAKQFADHMKGVFESMKDNTHRFLAGSIPEEALEKAQAILDSGEEINPIAKEFVDFVKFCEDTEKETGEPTFIYASY